MLVLTPPLEPDTASEAHDALPSPIAASMFTPWASGAEEAIERTRDEGSDIIPELMLELL